MGDQSKPVEPMEVPLSDSDESDSEDDENDSSNYQTLNIPGFDERVGWIGPFLERYRATRERVLNITDQPGPSGLQTIPEEPIEDNMFSAEPLPPIEIQAIPLSTVEGSPSTAYISPQQGTVPSAIIVVSYYYI